MARIVFASYMVRYPLGGVLSSSLQWIVGLHRLGHEVYFVEKSAWRDSCFDPERGVMSDDPRSGIAALSELLARFGLERRWCYVDAADRYHGLDREAVTRLFHSADVFIDRGLTFGAWEDEARHAAVRVFFDGDPGFCQMEMERRHTAGEHIPVYDAYFTVGLNLASGASTSPTAGKRWLPLVHPVVVDLFPAAPADPESAFTTVMNWHAHRPVEHGGRSYGQKDREFARFMGLPRLTRLPLEVAVSGAEAPRERLRAEGWRVRDAHQVTATFDAYRAYIAGSRGEFAVCKNVFVDTRSGWFSDRSAAYLASGRPVVVQETGFSAHLPCGEGLFAVRDPEEAAAAFEAIARDGERHAAAARRVAREHLDAERVLGGMLETLGVASTTP